MSDIKPIDFNHIMWRGMKCSLMFGGMKGLVRVKTPDGHALQIPSELEGVEWYRPTLREPSKLLMSKFRVNLDIPSESPEGWGAILSNTDFLQEHIKDLQSDAELCKEDFPQHSKDYLEIVGEIKSKYL